jgi:hypothetical protein
MATNKDILHILCLLYAQQKIQHQSLNKKKLASQTAEEYRKVIARCREVFEKKTRDYGTAWRILRLPSITDQIFIKAQRIRSVQEKGVMKINEDLNSEFLGMINYSIMALIQLELGAEEGLELSFDRLGPLYDKHTEVTLNLLMNKNHDYGEAWRSMRVSSITDIILMKLLRVKQIEDNAGKTLISEGVEANYQDIINYSVFALIKSGFINNASN